LSKPEGVEPSVAPPKKLWSTVSFTAVFRSNSDGALLSGVKLEWGPPLQAVNVAKAAATKKVEVLGTGDSFPQRLSAEQLRYNCFTC
jgi:hypothetical protein